MTKYTQGAAFEYEVRTDLLRMGYDAQRTAGSHSVVDIWAVPRRESGLLCVQCKTSGNIAAAGRRKFVAFCGRAGAHPILAEKIHLVGERAAHICYTLLEDT